MTRQDARVEARERYLSTEGTESTEGTPNRIEEFLTTNDTNHTNEFRNQEESLLPTSVPALIRVIRGSSTSILSARSMIGGRRTSLVTSGPTWPRLPRAAHSRPSRSRRREIRSRRHDRSTTRVRAKGGPRLPSHVGSIAIGADDFAVGPGRERLPHADLRQGGEIIVDLAPLELNVTVYQLAATV